MTHSNALETLRAALEEVDGLAHAGERVGYESAYRILRKAVAEVVEHLEGPRWHRPGEKVPASGIYATCTGREAALKQGDRFPPSASKWQLVREARHASS